MPSRFQRRGYQPAPGFCSGRGLSSKGLSPGGGEFLGTAASQSHDAARFRTTGPASPSVGYSGTGLGPRGHVSGGIPHRPQSVGGSLPSGRISFEGHFSVFRILVSGALVSHGRRGRNCRVVIAIVVLRKFFLVEYGFFAISIPVFFFAPSEGSSRFCSLG